MAWLTGFDPRFEEAILVLGQTDEPAILVGNECHGMAGRGAAPDAPPPVPGSEPAEPAPGPVRPLGDILAAEGVGPGSRIGVIGWKTYADRTKLEAPAFLVDELRRAGRPAGLVENAGDLLIDAADGLRVVNEVEQLRLSRVGRLPDLRRRAPLAGRPAARHDRAGGRPAAALERDPALLPPDADGRPAGRRSGCSARATGRSSAGPVHHRLRDLGRAQLPGRLRRGGRVRAVRGNPRLRRSPRRPLLRGGRRLVRGAPRRAGWWNAPGIVDHHLGDPFFGISLNPGHQMRARRVGRFAGRTGLHDRAPLGDGPAVDIIPATGTDVLSPRTSRMASRWQTQSLRGDLAGTVPDAWSRIATRRGSWRTRSASTLSRCSAVVESPAIPDAIGAAPRPGDDAGRLTGTARRAVLHGGQAVELGTEGQGCPRQRDPTPRFPSRKRADHQVAPAFTRSSGIPSESARSPPSTMPTRRWQWRSGGVAGMWSQSACADPWIAATKPVTARKRAELVSRPHPGITSPS